MGPGAVHLAVIDHRHRQRLGQAQTISSEGRRGPEHPVEEGILHFAHDRIAARIGEERAEPRVMVEAQIDVL